MTDLPKGDNATWFDRACAVMPGGVSSPVRSFSSVGGTPFTAVRGEGQFVYDVEGTQYLDFVQSYGAILLGHAHPKITSAIQKAAHLGSSFGMPTAAEVILAETICDAVSGCDQVRFCSSGTEATMSALRLARAMTGKNKIVKFEGCYHGHSDQLLVAGGSGVQTTIDPVPGTAGVSHELISNSIVVPYNEVPQLGSDVACVIVEPVAANMGLVAPEQYPNGGFLSELRRVCDESGTLLIFDEVITGFRLRNGSCGPLFGVEPDIFTFGKVIGGGCPVGAIGGKKSLMQGFAPTGPVYQAGTLSGNPLAMAAGKAVLDEVGDPFYEELETKVSNFAKGLLEALRLVGESFGIVPSVPNCGTLMSLHFYSEPEVYSPASNFGEVEASAKLGIYQDFFHRMLDKRIALAPGPYECLFIGASHSQSDLDRFIQCASESLEDLGKNR